jgi:nicotinamide phosphoribosyltransferase
MTDYLTNPIYDHKMVRRMRDRNFLLLTDYYKTSHYLQYPPDTQVIYSYMEPRVGAEYKDIVWCGLQFILKHYRFINTYITREMIGEAEFVINEMGGNSFFNREGWKHILNDCNGALPLRIYALPEGTVVKPGTPVLAIKNTDESVPWLTNYVESLLMHCYAMTNTATISYDIYKRIKKYCDLAGETVSPFHLNDFGLRGASSLTSAELCGLGHLLIFQGTDNIPAIEKAHWYYNSNVCGGSVIAAEHSTITSWGQSYECKAYRHIIEESDKRFGDSTTISLVCDSYDWRHAVKEYFCKELKDLILSRKGTIVVRPDTGFPPEVSTEIINMLWDSYGGTINDNGYKVLDPHIKIIYGDGIDGEMISRILHDVVTIHKFAPSNIIFGSGGAILQKHNRDTLRFAIKCSAIKRNNQWIDVCKTTEGKQSKAGRFDLPLVYENGNLLIEESIITIRNRILT